MQHGFQNITFRAGQAAPKVNLPAGTSTCPATLLFNIELNKGEIHCEDSAQKIPLERGKLGSCSACPVVAFCRIHLQLATEQVVLLFADKYFPF